MPSSEKRLVPSGITPRPWVGRIAWHRLVLGWRQYSHSRHSGVYSGITWSPGFDGGDTCADLQHHARAFMAEYGGKCAFRVVARQGEGIGMADARRLHFYQHFTGPGALQVNVYDFEGFARLEGDSCACFHGDGPGCVANKKRGG